MNDHRNTLKQVSWAAVCGRRLDRHGLSAPFQNAKTADVAAAICGAHAQVMTAAELSLALRMDVATRINVQDALWTEHSLIKTYGPRGTIHLLPAEDLPMWTGALSAVPYELARSGWNRLLTAEQAETIVETIAAVLEDTALTTDELTGALIKHLGSWAGDPVMPAFQDMWPRWRMVQGLAGMRGAYCFGPNSGRKTTYTNPRRWLPGFQPVDQKTALAELVRRYLHAYGPATPQQFARWLAAPRQWAIDLFDSLADELQQVQMEDGTAWLRSGDTNFPAVRTDCVCLLPYFDAYVVGSYPRELLFPGQASERALARGQAGNFPVLLVNGIVTGVWHQRRSGRNIHIIVEPFEDLTLPQMDGLNRVVERIGQILEAKAHLTIGPVNLGGHA